MSSKELEKSESEDSLNFDYNGIEDEISNQEENIDNGIEQNEGEAIKNEENIISTNTEEQNNNNNKDISINNDENIVNKNINNLESNLTEEDNLENIDNENDDSTVINSNSQSREFLLEKNNSSNKNFKDVNDSINNKDNSNSEDNNTESKDNKDNKDNLNDDNNNGNNNPISEDERNKLMQEDMLKECEKEKSEKPIYPNSTSFSKKQIKNDVINLKSDDGPHITMLYNNGLITEKKTRTKIKQDFLEDIIPKDIKFKKEKEELLGETLPNLKGFHKPDPINNYIYKMNKYKDNIIQRKEKISSCYLVTLGHSIPIGHESRQYQNYYYNKDRNVFTKNYINTTKSKIKQNTEYYHKYIDFDYELPSIINNLPYKTYLDFYNSDSYSPQLRRLPNEKYYFVNNIPKNKKNTTSIKIPSITNNDISIINNNNNKGKTNNKNEKLMNKSNIINNIKNINTKERINAFKAPIIRIKKNNEKLKKIKDIDIIMNQNKIDTTYNSKFILSS